MPGETTASTTRLPFWSAWPATQALFELVGPVLIAGVVAWLVYLVRVGFRSMFDDDHIGSTVVGTVVAAIAAYVGAAGTSGLLASLRSTAVGGPCPCCGAVAVRRFENLADPKSPPSPCGACIAYLRANGNEMREEALEKSEMIWRPYVLGAEQYRPAVKRTNRNYFKFAMPAMCAVCGDPDAPHQRDIGDGDAFSTHLGALGAIASVAADVSGTPSWSQKDHVLPLAGMGPSAPSEDDENSRGLSKLQTPVCAKHTEDAEPFGEALEYSSGKLEFASYRYYKAFCELNHIERAQAAVTKGR